MAGLWDRLTNEDSIDIHLIVAGVRAYFVSTVDGTKGASKAQIISALNSDLTTPLSQDAVNDLNAIGDALDALANNTLKLVYLANVEYAMIAAERSLINETKWRSDLGI